MPPPLDVDRDQVRMLCIQHGPREAARMCGIAEATVLDWCAKGKWLADTRIRAAKLPMPPSMRPIAPIKTPVDALTEALIRDGNATRSAAMRYARLTSEHAATLAEASPEVALTQASDVKSAVQVAALAGSWAVASGDSAPVVNIALIGMKLGDSESQ